MNRNKHILTFVLTLFISLNLFSQHKDGRKKVKVLKVSYITEELNLTKKEAQKFWPIYNKFETERQSLYHGNKNALKKEIEDKGGIDNLNEKDAKRLAKKMLAVRKTYYDAHVKYQTELSKVISYKKILKLDKIENDFTRRMFKRYRKVRKQKK